MIKKETMTFSSFEEAYRYKTGKLPVIKPKKAKKAAKKEDDGKVQAD